MVLDSVKTERGVVCVCVGGGGDKGEILLYDQLIRDSTTKTGKCLKIRNFFPAEQAAYPLPQNALE